MTARRPWSYPRAIAGLALAGLLAVLASQPNGGAGARPAITAPRLTAAAHAFVRVIVQGSTDLLQWQTLSTLTITNRSMSFIDVDAAKLQQRFYRAAEAKESPLAVRVGKILAHGEFELQLTGSSGQKVIVQATSDFATWTAIATNTFPLSSTNATVLDPQATNFSLRFYRTVSAQ